MYDFVLVSEVTIELSGALLDKLILNSPSDLRSFSSQNSPRVVAVGVGRTYHSASLENTTTGKRGHTTYERDILIRVQVALRRKTLFVMDGTGMCSVQITRCSL